MTREEIEKTYNNFDSDDFMLTEQEIIYFAIQIHNAALEEGARVPERWKDTHADVIAATMANEIRALKVEL